MLLVFSITPPEKNIRHNPGAAGDCAMVNRRGGEKACAMVPGNIQSKNIPCGS